MRGRPINRWFVPVLVMVLLAGLGYVLFPFLIDEERYRAPLEAGASFALGRRVTIEGPISLGLSLHPRLVLEDVHIANPGWASRPDLLYAARLEAQLSFLALLKRELVINKISCDGVDLLLEEGPHESNNWTVGTPSDRSGSSETEPPISATISKAGFLAIRNVTLAYQPYMVAGPPSPLTIVEGLVIPVNGRTRQFSLQGTFRDIPFALELTGGKIVDLIDLTEPWPIDGVVTAASTSVNVKGHLIGPLTALSIELESALRGTRLSDLNPLFDMDLPPLGPYEVTTSLSFAEDTLGIRNLLAKIGNSEFGGDLELLKGVGSGQLSGTLTAKTIQVNDFRFPEPASTPISPTDSPHSTERFASQTGMDSMDIDLECKVNRLLYGRIDLGTLALSAKLEKGLLSVASFQDNSFGGAISASLEVDGNHPAPIAKFHANAQRVNYGQALQAFEVTSEIAGSTHLDISVRGQGVTLPEFLEHATLSLAAGPSLVSFGKQKNTEKMELGIRRVTVKANQGEGLKASLKGKFRERAMDIVFVTGSLAQLSISTKPWPISLLARSDNASLTLKGGIRSGPEGMEAALAVALRGQQLNRFAPELPPSGPYFVGAQFTKRGSQYSLADLKGRLGESDVNGLLSLDMEEDIPHLSASLSSAYLTLADFSTSGDSTPPGDMLIPVEALQAFNADIKWEITRMRVEPVDLGELRLEGNLKHGRLAFTDGQGKLEDWKQTYAEFHGDLILDTRTDIPTLSGRASVQTLDYGHILQRVWKNNPVVGVANLVANFSSQGKSVLTMLANSTFKIEAQDVDIPVKKQHTDRATVPHITQAVLSSKGGGPLLLRAKGSFKDTPFTITSSSGDLRGLVGETHQWPLALAVQFPQLLIDLNGHLLFPINSENFNFQVSVKGESLKDVSFLSDTQLPDLGPLTLTGLLTQFTEGYHLTEFAGQLGPNDLAGHITFRTTGPRPKVIATLRSTTNEFGFLTKTLAPSLKPEEGTSLEGIADSIGNMSSEIGQSVVDMSSQAVTGITEAMGFEEKEKEKGNEAPVGRLFPDFEFSVDTLRSVDLDLDWQIQQVQSKGFQLGHISYTVKLDDGFLTIEPIEGTLWHGAIAGRIELDASQYVPTLAVQLTIQGLDVGFLDDTVGVTDLVKGNVDLIRLALRSRGDTLQEVLSRANGKAELVQGPFEINNKYMDFWAGDVFTLTLTKAWDNEETTKLNCLVGYFDIVDGEIQSDAVLFDTKQITVGGFGTLNLGSEVIDFILTPQPKHPTLATLANPVRIHGHLSDPDVTSDKLRIAQGGGWYLLGLVSPIGLTIVIPKIAGTTLGTGNENPCVLAMSEKQFTVQEVSELQEGFFDWMVRKMKGVFTNNEDSKEAIPNSEKSAP